LQRRMPRRAGQRGRRGHRCASRIFHCGAAVKRIVPMLLGLFGCTQLHVDAFTSREDEVHLEITEAVSGCDGMLTFGDTVATFTLSTDGKVCNVHFDARGAFIDIADVKQAYRDEVDGYPDTSAVSVFAMDADIADVTWVDGAGTPLSPPI